MTKGEYRVGIDLASNPTDSTIFTLIKVQAAGLIDLIETIEVTDGEVIRLKALAQTEVESAAMWACKAASKLPHTTGTHDALPSTPSPLGGQADPFVAAVREVTIDIHGSIGPWPFKPTLQQEMRVMRGLELRGFTNIVWADIADTLHDLRKEAKP